MRLDRHRKFADRYELTIVDDDGVAHDFTWLITPPGGVTRAAYEASQRREAALLVQDDVDRRADSGEALAAEGSNVTPTR